MSQSLKEAAAEVLGGNVKGKRGEADKPQRLPGEVQDLGAPVVKPDTPTGPDASKGVSKDTSKSSKSSVPGEKVHQMKNKQKVPMQEDPEMDDEDLLDEDEEMDDEDYLDEDEDYDNDDDEAMDDDDDSEEMDEDEVDEDEEIQEESYELPSVGDLEIDISEDIEAMFEGQDLSEEFKDKVSVVFETAIRANLAKYEEQLAEMFEASLTEAVASIQEEMETEVDKYLSYVVEEWVQDNEVAIESGLRNELTEDFMTGLRNLFVENYIDIPEDRIDVVEELTAKLAELEDNLNETLEKNIELSSVLKEHARHAVFAEAAEGLTDVQSEKLSELAEAVEFTTESEFTDKLNTLVESYFPTNKPRKPQMLDEEALNDPDSNQIEEEVTNVMMQKYVQAIGKTKK